MGYGWDIYIYIYLFIMVHSSFCMVDVAYTYIYILWGSDQPRKWDESRTTVSGSRIGWRKNLPSIF